MTKFDNDGREHDNLDLDIAVASDITINIGPGSDTATVFYIDKGSLGSGLVLRPSDNVSIVRVGGKTYKHPIPVSTEGYSDSKMKDFSSLVIRTHNNGTHLDVLVL